MEARETEPTYLPGSPKGKRKILWIPHAPWERLDGQRERHLIELLKQRHDIHVVTWGYNREHKASYFFRPEYLRGLLFRGTRRHNEVTLHHIPTVPNLTNYLARDKSHPFFLNSWIYRRSIRRLHQIHSFDVVVCGTNQWLFGDPPRLEGADAYFDYLDVFHDWQLGKISRRTKGVLCVSHYLMAQASPYYHRKLYSPNGVFLEKFRRTDAPELRRSLDLEGRRVVSLIGLTCSPKFYFVESMRMLQEKYPDLMFLMVGGGAARAPLEARSRRAGIEFLSLGQIPSQNIGNYFAITDVGLYPGEQSAVYDAACPIKVMEYSANRKPVVSSVTKELRHLGFPNVFLAEPNATDFAEKIEAALQYGGDYPDMSRYSWENISREFESFLFGQEPGL